MCKAILRQGQSRHSSWWPIV